MPDSSVAPKFVKNRADLTRGPKGTLRGHALDILEAGLARGVPGYGTRAKVRRDGAILTIDGATYDLDAYARVLVLGVGKASFPIAEALEDILGPYLTGGLLVLKKGDARTLRHIRIIEGAHPIPDETSIRAGEEMLAFAEACTERDLVLAPVTGGATALATIPHPGLTLDDLKIMNEIVLKSGADIKEMNIVRRHLCRLKGGRLVTAAQPAMVVTLSLQTALPGMPWPDMCLPDPETFADAIALLQRFRVWEKTPPRVRDFLEKAGSMPELETVKSFAGVNARLVMVGDPPGMCRAAADKAAELGYAPMILASRMHGEAKETGICLAGIADEVIAFNRPLAAPCALVSSGESPVTITGPAGLGGPNQELALSFASRANPAGDWVCASIDTDGTDGPTDIAGGIVDNDTPSLAATLGLSLPDALAAHDSGAALRALGGSIDTGHTGTNLQHLRVILIDAPKGGGDA